MRPEDLSGLIDADQGEVLRDLAAAVPPGRAIVEMAARYTVEKVAVRYGVLRPR